MLNRNKPLSMVLVAFIILTMLPTSGLAVYEEPIFTGSKGDEYYVNAAQNLSNFAQSRTYNGQFKDVSANAWYHDYVREAYAYGLVNGTSDTYFSPDAYMSMHEVVAMASRIHSIYEGNGHVFRATNPWYQSYVDYALDNGIIYSDDLWLSPRNKVAYALCNSLPSYELSTKNVFLYPIPNYHGGGSIEQYTEYPQIFRLYAAGVLTGSDSYCSFQGEDEIKRSDVVALAMRMIRPELRRSVTKTYAPSVKEILINGYWEPASLTAGQHRAYRFYSDGTYSVIFFGSKEKAFGTYSVDDGILRSSDYTISDIKYDPIYGVFGKDVVMEFQGAMLTVDALRPISQLTYDRAMNPGWS